MNSTNVITLDTPDLGDAHKVIGPKEAVPLGEASIARLITPFSTFRGKFAGYDLTPFDNEMVVPFELGDFVPLGALNFMWQECTAQEDRKKTLASNFLRYWPEEKASLFAEKAPSYFNGVNLNKNLRPIFGAEKTRVISDQLGNFHRAHKGMGHAAESLLLYYEAESMAFHQEHGLLWVQRTWAHKPEYLVKMCDIQKISSSSVYPHLWYGWDVSSNAFHIMEDGTLVKPNGIIAGALMIPRPVYYHWLETLQRGILPARPFSASIEGKPNDAIRDYNSFYLLEQGLPEEALDLVVEFLINRAAPADENHDIPQLCESPDFWQSLLGKSLTFEESYLL